MNLKKSLTIAAAAGALAAISVPAMAFEHTLNGSYVVKSFISNYETGGGGPIFANSNISNGATFYNGVGAAIGNGVTVPTAVTPGGAAYNIGSGGTRNTENLRTNSYVEQRARLFYVAKASDDLKLNIAFEIDSTWGDRAQSQANAARNFGGAMESDAVNLETKWVNLMFKIPSTPTTVVLGIQPVKDQLKGIFLDADLAGIMTTTKIGSKFTQNLGYFRAYDQSFFSAGTAAASPAYQRGNVNLDIFASESIYQINKDSKAGFVYYLYNDGRSNSINSAFDPYGAFNARKNGAVMVHALGLFGETKVSKVTLSGFLAYQAGIIKDAFSAGRTTYQNAWAYNLAAKAPVGMGTLKGALLYTSGTNLDYSADGRGHHTGWIGVNQSQNNTWSTNAGANTYNESGMMLLNRNALSQGTTTDVSVVYNSGNGTSPLNPQGVYLLTMGYDANITPKVFVNGNVGFAWAEHVNGLRPYDFTQSAGGASSAGPNGASFQGTEINLEAGYKMYDNLTAKIQAAYVILGGYYNNSVRIADTSAKGYHGTDPEDPYTVRMQVSYNF